MSEDPTEEPCGCAFSGMQTICHNCNPEGYTKEKLKEAATEYLASLAHRQIKSYEVICDETIYVYPRNSLTFINVDILLRPTA